jgi:hypothetical protein
MDSGAVWQNVQDWPALARPVPDLRLETWYATHDRDAPMDLALRRAVSIEHAIGVKRKPWVRGPFPKLPKQQAPGWRNYYEAGDPRDVEVWNGLVVEGFAVGNPFEPRTFHVLPAGFLATGHEWRSAVMKTAPSAHLHRLALWRVWAPGPVMAVVGLNPSTADGREDDATIRRCRLFAQREGCGALAMVNLYTLVSTDPKGLREPRIRKDLDDYPTLRGRILSRADVVVFAWGRGGADFSEGRLHMEVDRTKVKVFGFNADRTPVHPLYQRADCPLVPYWPSSTG